MMFRLSNLSPRRRLFVVGLAAALAVALATVAVSVVTAGSSSAPRAAGPVAAPVSGVPRAAGGPHLPPQNRPGPVLLVPGYGGNTGSLSSLAAQIRATGRQAFVLHLPGNGTGSLLADASVLNAAAGRALRGGAPSVDVIGYSAGGVVALLWALDDGGIHKARRLVTLGSPFHGTSLAAAGAALVPGDCPVACQQLVPGSSLLRQLARGRLPARPPWISLWTTGDQTVTPPDSARLPGALNVPVQSICPAEQVSHSQLPTDPVVTAMVLQAIGRGPVRPPTPADCRA